MKLFKLFICAFMTTFCLSLNVSMVDAASFSVGASQSTVSPNGKFTVTIQVSGAGQFSVSSSNGTVSESSIWVDGSSSVSVTAGSSGTTTVTVTAVDVTATDETPVTGSKTVSVNIKSPVSNNNTQNNNTQTNNNNKPQVDNRSKVNTLSSLNVSPGKLNIDFSPDKTAYQVSLTSENQSITIFATAKDSKATVSGTGKKDLKIGSQTFAVTVKAENGSKKVYSITVDVTEKPTTFTSFQDKKLGLLTDVSNAKIPDGFQESKVQLEGKEITAWVHEPSNLTIVYLMDENESKNLYVYEDGQIVNLFQQITIQNNKYIILEISSEMKKENDLVFGKVSINDIELEGWKFEDETRKDFYVVYLMNMSGEKNLYSYDTVEQTLQRYVPSDNSKEKELETKMYIFVGTTGLFLLTTVGAIYRYMSFKKKSISVIKDYYQSKNIDE